MVPLDSARGALNRGAQFGNYWFKRSKNSKKFGYRLSSLVLALV